MLKLLSRRLTSIMSPYTLGVMGTKYFPLVISSFKAGAVEECTVTKTLVSFDDDRSL